MFVAPLILEHVQIHPSKKIRRAHPRLCADKKQQVMLREHLTQFICVVGRGPSAGVPWPGGGVPPYQGVWWGGCPRTKVPGAGGGVVCRRAQGAARAAFKRIQARPLVAGSASICTKVLPGERPLAGNATICTEGLGTEFQGVRYFRKIQQTFFYMFTSTENIPGSHRNIQIIM